MTYQCIYSAIINANETFFKPGKPKSKTNPEPERPWWNLECKKITAAVRRAYSKWKKSPCTTTKCELNRLESIQKKIILKNRDKQWQEFTYQLNHRTNKPSKTVWKFINSMLGNNNNAQSYSFPITYDQNNSIDDDATKAEYFVTQFSDQNDDQNTDDPEEEELDSEILNHIVNAEMDHLNVLFTKTELNEAMNKKKSRAAGIDKITYEMLTNLSTENRDAILYLFNLMFTSGFIPEDWKTAIIIPIPKPGKPPEKTSSYRPISLTSCLGKLMEKMINNRLK